MMTSNSSTAKEQRPFGDVEQRYLVNFGILAVQVFVRFNKIFTLKSF